MTPDLERLLDAAREAVRENARLRRRHALLLASLRRGLARRRTIIAELRTVTDGLTAPPAMRPARPPALGRAA